MNWITALVFIVSNPRDIYIHLSINLTTHKQTYKNNEGGEIIEDYIGYDISEVFHQDNVHAHSQYALNMMKKFKIGEFIDDEDAEAELEE